MTDQELLRYFRQNGQGGFARVNPMNHAYFGTADGGDATASLGSGDGRGFYDFSGIPGAERFMPRDVGGDDTSPNGINPAALSEWMQQNGYSLNEYNEEGTARRWMEDGSGGLMGNVQETSTDDSAFWKAAMLAGGFLGGSVAANPAFGAMGKVGSGAVGGATAGGIADGPRGALTGAALGGALGYVGGQFGAPDAMAEYMRTGASEGSTIGNALTGAGGQAGAVGAGSIAAQMGIPSDFDPSSLFRDVADPTAALQPLGDMAPMPGQMPSMTPNGAGQFGEPFNLRNPYESFTGSEPFNPSMDQFTAPNFPPPGPYDQTVDVIGERLSPEQTRQMSSTLPEVPPPLGPLSPTGAGPVNPATANPFTSMPPLSPVPPVPFPGSPGALPATTPSTLADIAKYVLPIAGAVAGSQPSGGGTSTRDQRIDPRMDEFVYGPDGIPAMARARFNANPSGMNENMRRGLAMRTGLLTDPRIGEQLAQYRNQGLLQSQGNVAGNPFTDGRMTLGGAPRGLLEGMQIPRDPNRRFTG